MPNWETNGYLGIWGCWIECWDRSYKSGDFWHIEVTKTTRKLHKDQQEGKKLMTTSTTSRTSTRELREETLRQQPEKQKGKKRQGFIRFLCITYLSSKVEPTVQEVREVSSGQEETQKVPSKRKANWAHTHLHVHRFSTLNPQLWVPQARLHPCCWVQ